MNLLPFSVGNDGNVVSQEPFLFMPAQNEFNHYSLIGRIETPNYPNPMEDIDNVDDLAAFILSHPNYAWRNVAIADMDAPVLSISVDYDQGIKGSEMFIALRCKNLSLGSTVAFYSQNPGTQPIICLEPTSINNSESQVLGVYSQIPDNWKGTITYEYWSNGKNPSSEFEISLDVFYCIGFDHDLYKYAIEPEPHFPDKKLHPNDPKKLIRIGSHSTRVR